MTCQHPNPIRRLPYPAYTAGYTHVCPDCGTRFGTLATVTAIRIPMGTGKKGDSHGVARNIAPIALHKKGVMPM